MTDVTLPQSYGVTLLKMLSLEWTTEKTKMEQMMIIIQARTPRTVPATFRPNATEPWLRASSHCPAIRIIKFTISTYNNRED